MSPLPPGCYCKTVSGTPPLELHSVATTHFFDINGHKLHKSGINFSKTASIIQGQVSSLQVIKLEKKTPVCHTGILTNIMRLIFLTH